MIKRRLVVAVVSGFRIEGVADPIACVLLEEWGDLVLIRGSYDLRKIRFELPRLRVKAKSRGRIELSPEDV